MSLAEDLIERVRLRPRECVLDVACGTGIVSRYAALRVGTLGHVTGVELSPAMIEIARHAAAYFDQIEFLEGSALELPVADAHFDVVSAFIKSVRGSDVDASLYWLARMIEAGEEPRFIVRRMVILAAEDIGLADPNALLLASACQQAVHFVAVQQVDVAALQSPLRPAGSEIGVEERKAELLVDGLRD